MLGDTIVAQASAPGVSERAVLRLSGPAAFAAAALVFRPPLEPRRAVVQGEVMIRNGAVAARALTMVGPRSFTGEDTVELHVPGSPLLVRLLLEDLAARGAPLGVRPALPGEFTARACRNGRLDGVRAEGLLLLLHAADRAAAAQALQWLRGGLAAAMVALRGALQDVLADCETHLDFASEEIGVLAGAAGRDALPGLIERTRNLLAGLPVAAPGGEVLLLGAANIGKSALSNTLAGRPVALVADRAGTTRDVLRVEVEPGVVVWDAPGDLPDPADDTVGALALRDRLAGAAQAVLIVLDAAAPQVPAGLAGLVAPILGVVFTRIDRVAVVPPLPAALAAVLPPGTPVLATSSVRGDGLAELRDLLRRRARAGGVVPGGPLREALGQVHEALQRAAARSDRELELVAADLQHALRAIDDVEGRHSPEQLLDRIYGRFCLGK